jgi:hypothetical protein
MTAYLDARHERVNPGAAAKLAYILTCLHKAIETEIVEQRIADLEKLVAHIAVYGGVWL